MPPQARRRPDRGPPSPTTRPSKPSRPPRKDHPAELHGIYATSSSRGLNVDVSLTDRCPPQPLAGPSQRPELRPVGTVEEDTRPAKVSLTVRSQSCNSDHLQRSTEVCVMFQKGRCSYGEACFKTHIREVPLMAMSTLASTGVAPNLPQPVSGEKFM